MLQCPQNLNIVNNSHTLSITNCVLIKL